MYQIFRFVGNRGKYINFLKLYLSQIICSFIESIYLVDNRCILQQAHQNNNFNITYQLIVDYNKLQQSQIKKAMSSAQQRTQKLLIFAGDQDMSLEHRDFNKMVEIIVKQYLDVSKPIYELYEQFLIEILTGVIRRVPLKYHIYAGLTAEIRRVNPSLSSNIVKVVVSNCQKDLNNLKLHESINNILYLSELMNLEVLNSLCFFNLIDDIMAHIQNTKNINNRQFFILVFSRTLHNFCYSLNKKVYYQFKSLIQKAKKYCNKNPQFCNIIQLLHKQNLNDGSLISRIYPQQISILPQNQIQLDIKLKLEINNKLIFQNIQYYFQKLDQSDKLYQEFQKNQSWIHLTNIQQIIQLIKSNGTYMIQKIINYIKYQSQKTTFIQRYIIDLIIGKALKSNNVIIQSYILIKLIQWNRIYAQLLQIALIKGLIFTNQHYNLGCQIKYADVLSYIIINWPTNKDDMSDLISWDWNKFLSNKFINYQGDQINQAKKNVLLQIICQKISLLCSDYCFCNQLKKYAPSQDLKSPTKYKKIQQMQKLQLFQQYIAKKQPSQQILPQIKSQTQYQIFIESLFEKTSQSHTHLQILTTRYQKIFKTFKQDYDWTLFHTIRSYWIRSLFHRLLYLEIMIDKQFVDYKSYVSYIDKVQINNEEQQQWIKIQLNQLNKLYQSKLKQ